MNWFIWLILWIIAALPLVSIVRKRIFHQSPEMGRSIAVIKPFTTICLGLLLLWWIVTDAVMTWFFVWWVSSWNTYEFGVTGPERSDADQRLSCFIIIFSFFFIMFLVILLPFGIWLG